MITQEEFVADCYLNYAILGLEQGNPMHGVWNKCHYPAPKCLGGTEWIWLLEKDHAIQGLLQSEEYNVRCFSGKEKKYIPPEYINIYVKWMKIGGQQYGGHYKKFAQSHPEFARQCAVKAGQASAKQMRENPEQTTRNKKYAGKFGAVAQHSQRIMCTVTGFISTPTGISRYQKKRGIDPTNRVRLE